MPKDLGKEFSSVVDRAWKNRDETRRTLEEKMVRNGLHVV